MFDRGAMCQLPVGGTLAVLVILLYGGMGNAQQAEAPAGVTQAITCFADTWNQHDMVAFGQCFASDADFVNDTGRWWKGRATIQKNHSFMHGTIDRADSTVTFPPSLYGIYKASTLRFTSIAVRILRPDTCIAHAAWQITGDARTPEPRTGMMTIVVNNETGRWYIVALQNTETPRAVK